MKTNLTSLSNIPLSSEERIVTITPLVPPMPVYSSSALTTKTSSNIETNTANYVPTSILDDVSLNLGLKLLDKLPYEDNNKITFKNLVVFLSEIDAKDIDNAKTDEQIVDKQIELLFDMKNMAKTTTQDGQTLSSRNRTATKIRQKLKLFDELANKASFNNRTFNKVKNDLKIGATRSDNIGNTRFETGVNILKPNKVSLTFFDSNNKKVNIKEVEIGHKYSTGIAVLSEAINDNYDKLHIKASWVVNSTANDIVKAGKISNLKINGIRIGTINDIMKYDQDGRLVAALNNLSDDTGVVASIDARGHLNLASIDGRGIVVEGEGIDILSLDTQTKKGDDSLSKHSNYGKLTLVKHNSTDIKILNNKAAHDIGFSKDEVSESTINLRHFKGSSYTMKEALSIGALSNNNSLAYIQTKQIGSYPSSVITYRSAIIASDIFDSSILQLQEIKKTLNTNMQSPLYPEQKMNKGLLVSKSI